MQTIIRNMYKTPGIFICRHPRHRRFDYQVSPYHIIEEKRCLEEGCVQFVWKCRIYAKDFRCPRGFKHVGKDCFPCKHYDEDKICRKPEAIAAEHEMAQFWRKLDEYRLWLSSNLNRALEFSGTIATFFPLLYMVKTGNRIGVKPNGYLIGFDRGHIGYDFYDDKIYLRVGGGFINRWNPSIGARVEFRGILKSDKGRLIFIRPSRVEIEPPAGLGSDSGNGGRRGISRSQAVVGAATGAVIEDDCAPCRGCNYGAFVESATDDLRQVRRRRFFCLRGVKTAASCPVRLERIILEHKTGALENR